MDGCDSTRLEFSREQTQELHDSEQNCGQSRNLTIWHALLEQLLRICRTGKSGMGTKIAAIGIILRGTNLSIAC